MSNWENNPIFKNLNIKLKSNPLYVSQGDNSKTISNKDLNINRKPNPLYVSQGEYGNVNNSKKEINYKKINQEIIDKLPLPDGWEARKTKEGRTYYVCFMTRHTQWLHPGIPIGTPTESGLPYGWEKKIDNKTQKEYFVCHVGRFNTRSPPVGRRNYLDKKEIETIKKSK